MRWIGGIEGDWHDPDNWEDYGVGNIEILPVNSPSETVVITAREPVFHTCEHVYIGHKDCDRVRVIFEEDVNFQIIHEQWDKGINVVNADVVHLKNFLVNTIDGVLDPKVIILTLSGLSTFVGYGELAVKYYSAPNQEDGGIVKIYGGCELENRESFYCGIMNIRPNFYLEGEYDPTPTALNFLGETNIGEINITNQSISWNLSPNAVINSNAIDIFYLGGDYQCMGIIHLNNGRINVGRVYLELTPIEIGADIDPHEFAIDMDGGKLNLCELYIIFNYKTPVENFVPPKMGFQNTENSEIIFQLGVLGDVTDGGFPTIYIYSNYKIDDFVLPETVEIIGDIDIGFDSTDWQHGSEGITFSSIKDLKFIGTDVENEASIYGYNYNSICFKAQNLEVLPFENGIYKISGNYGGYPEFIIGGDHNTIVDLDNCILKTTKAVQPEGGKTYYKALTRKGNVDDGDNEGWLFEESTTFSTPIEITERTTESVKAAVEILEYDPATSKTPQILSLQGMLETYNLQQYSYRVPFVVNYANPDAEYRFDLLSELEETPDMLEKVSMTEPYWDYGTSFVTDQIYFTPIYTGGYELVLFENDIEVDRVQISVEGGVV